MTKKKRTNLATVFAAVGVSGAQKVPRDGLQVFAIALAVPPDGQRHVTQQRRAAATCDISRRH